MVRRCVLLVGHGSRDEAANLEAASLVDAYRAAHPRDEVRPAYIELQDPLVEPALMAAASTFEEVVVVPLFLFGAGHVKNDLPIIAARVRTAHPRCRVVVAAQLGVHPNLLSVASDRISPTLPEDPRHRASTALVVVGRGSSDPDANGDLFKVARMLGEGRGLMHVEPTFLGITTPQVPTSLDLVGRMRPERVVVLPYLLFGGRLSERLAKQVAEFAERNPWIKTTLAPHLGVDPRLIALMDERIRQAESGEGALPCDTCQYRTDLPAVASQVGGLKALLYSVRHTLTHSQAMLPVHLHRPLKKHVLVCANADCVDKGAIGVLDAFRREVKRTPRPRELKVTRTACMGRCGEGPSVAVYPDGVFYRKVSADDVESIVKEHLLGDRLVGRLVDDILQG